MTKKAVIAAAGRGTRMLHLTKDRPKHLIKVCGRPFISYLFDNLLKAGYEELILVVGYKKEMIEEFLKNSKYKVHLVDQFSVLGKEKYGTACALKSTKNIVGNNNFLMVYGDHVFSVKDLKTLNIEDEYCYVSSIYSDYPEKYGALKTEGEFLKQIIEKPKKYVGNFVNAGLYKFTPEVFYKISQIKLSERGEYELTDAVNLLAKEKKVKVNRIKDYRLDFTNPEDVAYANKFLKKWKS